MSIESLDFLVARDDLRMVQWAQNALPELAADQVLLAIDRFAFTANNITYASFGDAMKYWDFFPAPTGFGIIPVWGFADIVQSRHDDLAIGERIYGYFPISSHLIVTADRVSRGGFVDAAPHRAPLAAVYNQYSRVANNPFYAPEREAAQAVLQPLFMTSFLIDDFLDDNGFFGAQSVLISSASSKTSLGLAFVLKRARREGIEIVGLTSRSNISFVESTGYYDRVVAYDDIPSMIQQPSVFVDMAGGGNVRAAVHTRLGDALKYSCAVGGTHWEDRGATGALPGPKPVLFFAPAQIKKRGADWGPGGLEKRYGPAWAEFLGSVKAWLKTPEARGRENLEAVYRRVLEGKASPAEGLMTGVVA